MSEKVFHYTIGIILAVLGIVHIFRLIHGWEAVVAGWEVPLWVSGVAVPIAILPPDV